MINQPDIQTVTSIVQVQQLKQIGSLGLLYQRICMLKLCNVLQVLLQMCAASFGQAQVCSYGQAQMGKSKCAAKLDGLASVLLRLRGTAY